jgi:hypothetical protein
MEDKNQTSFTDMFFVSGEELRDESVDESVTEGKTGVETIDQEPEDITPDVEEVPDEGDTGEDTGSEKPDEKQGEQGEGEPEDASSQDPEPQAPTDAEESVSHIESVIDELVKDESIVYNEEKEYDMTVDGLKEIISENVQHARDHAMDHFKGTLDDEGQKILDVLASGGSVKEYFQQEEPTDFSSIPVLNQDGSINENNAVNLIGDWMTVQKYTEDEIEERLGDLAKAGLLQKEAERSRAKLSQWQDEQAKNKEKQAEEQAAIQREEARQRAEAFKEDMLGTVEISGFKISKDEAAELYDFVSKPGKDGKTAFEKVDTDEARKLYAYFAMKGFDKEALSREIATEKTRTIKKRISNFRDSQVAPTGQSVRRDNNEGGSQKIPWSFTG